MNGLFTEQHSLMYIRTRVYGYFLEVSTAIRRRLHWVVIIFSFLQQALSPSDIKLIAGPMTDIALGDADFLEAFFTLVIIQSIAILFVFSQQKFIFPSQLEYFKTLNIRSSSEWLANLIILFFVNTLIWIYLVLVLLVALTSFQTSVQIINLSLVLINVTLVILVIQKFWLAKEYKIFFFVLALNSLTAYCAATLNASINLMLQALILSLLILKFNNTRFIGEYIKREYVGVGQASFTVLLPKWSLVQSYVLFSEYRVAFISRILCIGLTIYLFWLIRFEGGNSELGSILLLMSGSASLLVLSSVIQIFARAHEPVKMYYQAMSISQFSIKKRDLYYFLMISIIILFFIVILFSLSGFVNLYECVIVCVLWLFSGLLLGWINIAMEKQAVLVSTVLTICISSLGIYILK